MHDDILEILLTNDEIRITSKSLGQTITSDYKNKTPLLIGLLKGCVPFMAELTKNIDLYLDIDYMKVSSYHGDTKSSEDVILISDIEIDCKDRDVIIVEDIVDTGRTTYKVLNLLLKRGAKSVEVVTLLDKPLGRVIDFKPKYIGKTIPKKFVVGFGLDYQELYRNLDYVGVLKPHIYEKRKD